MKAILINPHKETITEVEYSGNYKEIYDLIDCRTFDSPDSVKLRMK